MEFNCVRHLQRIMVFTPGSNPVRARAIRILQMEKSGLQQVKTLAHGHTGEELEGELRPIHSESALTHEPGERESPEKHWGTQGQLVAW